MAREIIGGPRKNMPSAPSGLSRPGERDVMGYQAPYGPTNINDGKNPGLHGDNFEESGTQEAESVRGESSGSPGLGGRIRSVQGRH